MTERVKRLKELMLKKSHFQFRTEKNLSILNIRTKDLPFIMRKALSLKLLLKEMPIFIQEGELIVGGRTLFNLPEYIKEEEKNQIPRQDEVLGYGDIFNTAYNLCQDERGYGEFNGVVPGYEKILNLGLNKISEIAEEEYNKTYDPHKKSFYEAVRIVCEAGINFARRYSQEAKRLAEKTANIDRKRELEKISEVCKNIPAFSASSFHEALQSFYFSHLIIWASGHFLVPIGRFDQYIYPFYKKDIEKGIISKERAFELLQCLWIKLNSDRDKTHGKPNFEGDTGQTLMLAGKTSEGKDAVNELSYLCLRATMQLKMSEPRVQVRLHKRTPKKFIKECAKLIKMGMGFPTVCNDEIIIPTLVDFGYSLSDARNYCLGGCWEITIPGKADDRTNSGVVNLPRCLEWTLNNGRNFQDGEKLGLDTGPVEEITSFEDLFNRFKKEVSYYIERIVENCNKAVFAPSAFLSLTLDNCLKQGKDISEGGCQYNNTGILGNGLATAADSLLVIKKVVFEEKKISLLELKKVLLSNFKGKEYLRQWLINKVPKYGNDIDEADNMAKEVALYFCEEVSRHKNNRGGYFKPGLFSAGTFVFVGKKLGASPDGRKSGESFSINASPSLSQDKKGPTAVINSFVKLDLSKAGNGAIIDLTFHPTALSGKEGEEKLASFLFSFVNLGGMQMQASVIDSKILKEAQKHPERYQNLMVRIWGFSTYFVNLPKEFQEHIIARREYR